MQSTVTRIRQYIDYKGISVRKFEELNGFSNGSFASQFKNNKTIGVDKVENILHNFKELNPSWLLTGIGSMEIDQTKPKEVPNNKGVPLLPMDAIAGKGLGAFNDLKVERYYDVYEFRSADFLITVKGSSMYPKYNSGDILACKMVQDRLFIQWNKTHVIYSETQGAMVKRLCKATNPKFIICKSDNKDYEPFEVPVSDITNMAIVIGVIRLE